MLARNLFIPSWWSSRALKTTGYYAGIRWLRKLSRSLFMRTTIQTLTCIRNPYAAILGNDLNPAAGQLFLPLLLFLLFQSAWHLRPVCRGTKCGLSQLVEPSS